VFSLKHNKWHLNLPSLQTKDNETCDEMIYIPLFILNRVSRDFLCTIIIMTLIFLCIKYKFKSFKNKFHNRVHYLITFDRPSMVSGLYSNWKQFGLYLATCLKFGLYIFKYLS